MWFHESLWLSNSFSLVKEVQADTLYRMLSADSAGDIKSSYRLPTIVIPAYEPRQVLVDICTEVLAIIPDAILIVVDDGSSSGCKHIFEKLERTPRLRVIRHAVNLGKGQALKTAFNYSLVEFPESVGVVTADADGQHLPLDVARVYRDFLNAPQCLWLGARHFEGRVPLRSRIGNWFTRKILTFTTGLSLQDTQTGLRGIPKALVMKCLKIRSSGYEFELDMLLRAKSGNSAINEIRIDTVYENGNESSHFNPAIDSLKIYFVLLRFISSSLLAATLDAALFAYVFNKTQSVGMGLVVGRILIGCAIFFINKTFVFRSKYRLLVEALEFAVLVAVMMLISFGFIQIFSTYLGVNVYVAKIFAECLVFLMSFTLQRWIVFRPRLNQPGD